jgi:hypothetical protein
VSSSNSLKSAIKACNAAVSSGSITPQSGCINDKKIGQLQQHGPNYSSPDAINQDYVGKVTVKPDGSVEINLTTEYTGDLKTAQAAGRYIKKEYGKAGVMVNLTPASPGAKPDLVIHGASLEDFVAAGVACSCNGAANLGGWGPRYNTSKTQYSNQLLVNGFDPNPSRAAAHEFGHKMGLSHRSGGIMDYPDQNQGPVSPSDVNRIRNLYGTPPPVP